jgi:cation transporter-like permease
MWKSDDLTILVLMLFAGLGGWLSGYMYFGNLDPVKKEEEKWERFLIAGVIALLVGAALSLLNAVLKEQKAWLITGIFITILISGTLGGVIGFFYNSTQQLKDMPKKVSKGANQSPATDASQRTVTTTNTFIISILMGIGAALLIPLLLHIVTSNLLSDIKDSPEKIFILAGYCLAAAISSQYFIKTIIDKLRGEAAPGAV